MFARVGLTILGKEASDENSDGKSSGETASSSDGKTYRTVRIGDQVWFAENLNYDDGYGLFPNERLEYFTRQNAVSLDCRTGTCSEGDYKISGYSWDFGDEDSDVTTSGAEAYKKFSTFESVTPLVTISSDVEMDGKSYSTVQTLACPTVRAGVSETTIAFSSKVKVKLKAASPSRRPF